MWGTFLSEPLRIVASVGRYPADWLMRRMPIPVRINPFLRKGCPSRIYAGLARVSPGCPPDRGRLHTCYSPVRRSPAVGASTYPAAPRLAGVKPAASVHPEPGSNSPLVFLFFSFSVCLSRPSFFVTFGIYDGIFYRSLFFPFVSLTLLRQLPACLGLTLSCPVAILSMFSSALSGRFEG